MIFIITLYNQSIKCSGNCPNDADYIIMGINIETPICHECMSVLSEEITEFLE